MQQKNTWLLPDGIEELLPEQARHVECLRTKLLTMFNCWGYDLVIPPFIDFLDSLLTGAGHDLDLQTFKLTDQISGELLGIRADMTPQVARIDAHNLKHDWPTRLCYAGTVLHTRGDALEKSRSPMQIGAELYGHKGLESDLEVICLMLEMLALTGLTQVHLDLGHVGIYRALAEQAGLNAQQERELFAVLQRKDRTELNVLLTDYKLATDIAEQLLQLPNLNGEASDLAAAINVLKPSHPIVTEALQDLSILTEKIAQRFPALDISFDLAELRGYHYHTGVVFAAFIPGVGKEIARGGRYDNIGKVFGRARPATGFSADLKTLATLAKIETGTTERIFAPYRVDADLQQMIRDLRAQNKVVIQELPGQTGNAKDLGCQSILIQNEHQHWVIQPLA